MHPGDRAAFWIDHVIKYGGKYMRNPALDMTVVQRNLIDVYALLLAVGVCILLVLVYSLKCAFRCCKRLCVSRKEKRE